MTKKGTKPADGDVFTTIKQVNRAAEVKTQLIRAIEEGHFKPGERIPSERELAERFGVSRVSVREAIRALEAMHLVHVHQGRGSIVSDAPASGYSTEFLEWLRFYRHEVLELFKVRGCLDALAASEAATHATRKQLTEIRALRDRFEGLAKEEPVRVSELAECDREFHTAIARASGSALLEQLLSDLNTHLIESRTLAFQVPVRLAISMRGHREIVEAIETRCPAVAQAATSRHIAHGEAALTVALARRGAEAGEGNGDGHVGTD